MRAECAERDGGRGEQRADGKQRLQERLAGFLTRCGRFLP